MIVRTEEQGRLGAGLVKEIIGGLESCFSYYCGTKDNAKEVIMNFGNWVILEQSIEWRGEEQLNFFVIPKDDLTAIRYDKRGSFFYNWILLATEEDWLTQDDLYDLNFAFVYAAALWGHEFSYETFDATLEEQYDQFEEEEDEDWG